MSALFAPAATELTPLDFRLLNDFQRDFPLAPAPYDELARTLGATTRTVLAALERLRAAGAISRIGAVFRPQAIGASTLAALAVPPARLEAVAAAVSRIDAVNHNYQRDHALNLWLVVTAVDAAALAATLQAIGAAAGAQVLALPLLEEYHIDLGFDLACARARVAPIGPPPRLALDAADRRLLAAVQDGLPLLARPYAALGARADLPEDEVLRRLRRWRDAGAMRRFGVVVRHHELGYRANAMCVWDVPDAQVAALGRALAREPAVTLCYRRERVPSRWPFNLYCMVHGRTRAEVWPQIERIGARHGLARFAREVLFSVRRFKQQGARYATG